MFLLANPLLVKRQKRSILANNSSLEPEDRALLQKVSHKISPFDTMYAAHAEHYFLTGLSALQIIKKALSQAKVESVRNILDMGSGYGRVMRYLAMAFPNAKLTACDTEGRGIRYCASAFGARPVYSFGNFNNLSLDHALKDPFDVIWCGSLVTHIDERAITDLLTFFRNHLTPNGIAIFTAHGTWVAERLKNRTQLYRLQEDAIESLLSAYGKNGYGYANYPETIGYGISVTSPTWMHAKLKQIGSFRELFLLERGWDNHQDVYALLKIAG
jgi:SAM-dependent methyltransferase